jgi:hypothetical protein
MPISHNKELIFIHIPKTGGTSIERVLDMQTTEKFFCYQRCGVCMPKILEKFNVEDRNKIKYTAPQHLTALQLETVLGSTIFNKYKKFTIVRNPFDRLVSEYWYVKQTVNPHFTQYQNLNFTQFVKKCFDLPNMARYILFDNHFTPQVEFINPFKPSDEFIVFKFEEIIKVFKWLDVEPVHLRQSNRHKHWREYYTPELMQMVYNFYKQDFDSFFPTSPFI